ncbi:MAG: DUF2905 domain-containing protein [Chloroflexota bacterium]|nr:DUF2905 domain-containing protein [Chloroflexota bacterium]
MSEVGRLLIFAGAALLLVGILLVAFGSALPLGRLPGDFTWERGGMRVSIPLATSLLLSLVLTIVANIVLRLLNR